MPRAFPSGASARSPGIGLMRNDCHSSHKARSDRRFCELAAQAFPGAAAVSAPRLLQHLPQLHHQRRGLVDGRRPGACFQSRSPRRETRKGNTSPWARKSGCSPGAPSRFSPTTIPIDQALAANRLRARSPPCGGSALASPGRLRQTKARAPATGRAAEGKGTTDAAPANLASSRVRIGF